jgi:endo-1,3-1,4-beta-glycanase ExoK
MRATEVGSRSTNHLLAIISFAICAALSNTAFSQTTIDEFQRSVGPSYEPLGPNWQVATWKNGYPFACTFATKNVRLSDPATTSGLLSLAFDGNSSVNEQTCAEVRTQASYQYGEYIVSMQPAYAPGTISSFFFYTGRSGTRTHFEIDIEFVPGKPGYPYGALHSNYWVQGKENPKPLDLGALKIDPYAGLREYKIAWTPTDISWHVNVGDTINSDWRELRREKVAISPKMQLMMNVWIGDDRNSAWSGSFGSVRQGAGIYDYVRRSK